MDNSFLYDGVDLSTHGRVEMNSYSRVTCSGYLPGAVKQENSGDPFNTVELASPELEKMFIEVSGNITTFPTPVVNTVTGRDVSNNVTPSDVTNLTELRTVTKATMDKKQQFSKGFDAALQRLYRERGHPFANDRESTCSPCPAAEASGKFENMPSPSVSGINAQLYDQEVPCYFTDEKTGIKSNPTTPSDAGIKSDFSEDGQERLKLAHRRARNREAAIRCRTKKLRRIAEMENRVKDLRRQNSDLTNTISSHKTEIVRLKKIILDHAQQGCSVINALMQ